jgi:hypothetical protein
MSPIDTICGDWPALAARLDAADTLACWAASEPALARLGGVAELAARTQPGSDPGRADELLGAVVRLAAVDGGDDEDAVLVLLYLLADGARALARQLRDLSPEIDCLMCGELTIQIRSFPWRRRTRAYAANLLLDTKAGLWRELRPHRRRRRAVVEVPVDPTAPLGAHGGGVLDRPAGHSGADIDTVEEIDLLDVLWWAVRRGVVNADEVALLVEPARDGQGGRATALARHGRSERSARRHRARVLAAVRAARWEYLAEAA